MLTAAYWIVGGVSGPVSNVAAPVLPEFVSVSGDSGLQLRTLVLRPGPRSVGYTLLRGSDPPLGAEALIEPPAVARALDRVVADLTAQHGTEARRANRVEQIPPADRAHNRHDRRDDDRPDHKIEAGVRDLRCNRRQIRATEEPCEEGNRQKRDERCTDCHSRVQGTYTIYQAPFAP